jgi:ribonuclease E
MLVDATHPEETRVAIVDGNWLSDFDFERASKKQLKGNIYLAKVIRIEPSLQAAFVEYGGNRHGFLPFSEIHPDYFRIPVADRPHDEEPAADEAADEGPEETVNAEAPEGFEPPSELDTTPMEGGAESEDEGEENEGNGEGSNEGAMPSAVEAAPEAPAPTAEFPPDAAQDLGLITDFGNAALPPPGPVEVATPLETVGGEVAEEERYRRPPRIRYKIQEVVKRRQVMLIQVVKEERGNKGAALTSFLSLAGRYCVLMPNTDHGGGVSRKITSHQDRRRMKEILDQLEIPEGMAVILRTAGMEQDPAEIQRDLEYLLRQWNGIREQTLQSTAPALIYEEGNLIKRSIRDLYSNELDEILVAGTKGYQLAVDFMRTIMPDQLDKVKRYDDPVPLFFRYNVEKQIDGLYSPTVQLRSGGYIVINPTEALVSIDVNSGRATRERHIESTALKTNLEAAEEIARQLRLRDLAGLVVIDFIDMEDGRHNAAVERRMKESMRVDRARLQIGRISPFGLLELSRQRLHPSLMEINFEKCPHCAGVGLVRSIDSSAISILRMIEEEGIRQSSAELILHVPTKVALYLLNQKRTALNEIEQRYNLQVMLHSDDTLVPPDCKLERGRGGENRAKGPAVNADQIVAPAEPMADDRPIMPPPSIESEDSGTSEGNRDGNRNGESFGGRGGNGGGGGRRRGRYGFGRNRPPRSQNPSGEDQPRPEQFAGNEAAPGDSDSPENDNIGNVEVGFVAPAGTPDQDGLRRGGRRRGRRGGRGRRNGGGGGGGAGRGPRDGNPREGNRDNAPRENYQPRDNFNQSRDPGIAAAPRAPYVPPASVHELDTTPRVPHFDAPPRQNRASAPSAPPPYEVVDKPTDDKPKGGWWRKLTGQ